jgi:hypothetical protein
MSAHVNAAGLPAAPGGPVSGPAGSISGEPQKKRAAFYIDGFNLYHAIDEMGLPHLKWLNMRQLCQALLDPAQETLVKVVWCSAQYTKDTGKMLRHREYVRALKAVDVTVVLGHFIEEDLRCKATCRQDYRKSTEKEGDVNVAINLIGDAFMDIYDHAYLVTADSDQAATARYFSENLAPRKLVTIAPPLKSHSKEILKYAHDSKTIPEKMLNACVFPQHVTVDGVTVATRHESYDPPKGWVNPNTPKPGFKAKMSGS